MNIAVTGASGFIGRRLVRQFIADGHAVHLLLRRLKAGQEPGIPYSIWDTARSEPPLESLSSAGAVIHLAGEPISQIWTTSAKQRISQSRAEGTERLVSALSRLSHRPQVLICASAVGYYGSRGDEILSEASAPGQGFLSDVGVAWEERAMSAEALGIRVVRLRLGVVLGSEGGALPRMIPQLRWFAPGRLGSGKQWISWIHAEDLVRLISHCIGSAELRGAVNATSPNPVTNAEFQKTIAIVRRVPFLFPVPAFAVRALLGEMSSIVLEGQRVMPKAALDDGFVFRFPDLEPALRHLLA